jgi:hypothetical protein
VGEIRINDLDGFSRPAQRERSLSQSILTRRGLGVLEHLLRRRLSDVDIRSSFEMSCLDLPASTGPPPLTTVDRAGSSPRI